MGENLSYMGEKLVLWGENLFYMGEKIVLYV